MQIRIVTLFPEMLGLIRDYGITSRAIAGGLLSLGGVNPRDFTRDAHRTVDDRPYGGGPGMVMQVEPLVLAVEAASRDLSTPSKVLMMAPEGTPFDDAKARELSAFSGVVLVCGRYEGIDQRFISSHVDESLSLGDFVLSGGELAALAVVDALARFIPGVLGHKESALRDSFGNGLLDYPHFTRPNDYAGQKVPGVLLSGDHEAIRRWRLKMSLGRTWLKRPDLLEKHPLSAEERELLEEYQREFEIGNLDVSEKP